MGKRGPKPRPGLHVVREGNPSKRPPRRNLELPPAELEEPKWATVLPLPAAIAQRKEMTRARKVASTTWRRTVARLTPAGLISDIDADALEDLAVTRAMIWITRRRWARGEQPIRGWPSLSQLQSSFVQLGSRFYMTPGDRANVDLGGTNDDDDDDFRPASTPVGDRRT